MSFLSSPSRTRGHPLQPPHREVFSQPRRPYRVSPGRAGGHDRWPPGQRNGLAGLVSLRRHCRRRAGCLSHTRHRMRSLMTSATTMKAVWSSSRSASTRRWVRFVMPVMAEVDCDDDTDPGGRAAGGDPRRPAHGGSLSRNFTAGTGRAITCWAIGVWPVRCGPGLPRSRPGTPIATARGKVLGGPLSQGGG
jgi:hypothetical protein